MPTLVNDSGKVIKYRIKEIKFFVVHLHSQLDHTIIKWDQGINFMQEELNSQIDAHDVLYTKGHIQIIMSMKKIQYEIKAEKASLVKIKGDVIVHDSAHSHLEANMTDEKKVKAID